MTTYTDPGQHVFWLASRALGVTALVLVALSVGLGLALSGRIVRVPGGPARVKHLHEALSLAALITIVAHGVTLIGDSYLRPGLSGVLLPFAMTAQPVWTGVGILAGWLAAIVTSSFYVRRLITTQVWRWLHRWTLAVYVMAVAHTLGSGSDAGAVWLQLIVAATAAPIVFSAAYRLLPTEPRGDKQRRRERAPGAVRPAEAP
jgi:methionine sulfoxide reductase heme-binding subunit